MVDDNGPGHPHPFGCLAASKVLDSVAEEAAVAVSNEVSPLLLGCPLPPLFSNRTEGQSDVPNMIENGPMGISLGAEETPPFWMHDGCPPRFFC